VERAQHAEVGRLSSQNLHSTDTEKARVDSERGEVNTNRAKGREVGKVIRKRDKVRERKQRDVSVGNN